MIVASGSTPLITLVKAAQLDVLHEPFDEVVISDAAFRELTTNPHLSEEADQIRPELRLSGTALRVLMALFTTIDLAYECRLAFFRGHYASGVIVFSINMLIIRLHTLRRRLVRITYAGTC